MSTNYYMLSQSKGFVEEYFPGEYELVDVPMFGYAIHIGKRSIGWKPLFQEHKNAYKSVSELMDFIKLHAITHAIYLYDEYGTILTEKELKENLLDWKKARKTVLQIYTRWFYESNRLDGKNIYN